MADDEPPGAPPPVPAPGGPDAPPSPFVAPSDAYAGPFVSPSPAGDAGGGSSSAGGPSGAGAAGDAPPGYGPTGSGTGGSGTGGSGTGGYGPPGSGPPGSGPPGSGPPGYGPIGYPPGAAPGYGAPGYGSPAYGPPGYGQQGYGYGYGYTPPASNNGLAVGSLICGILGIAVCQIVGIAALIMGYIARKRIRETGEQGAGMALAGIILGWVSVALLLAIVLFYVGFGIIALRTADSIPSTPTRRTPTTFRSGTTSTTERINPTTTTRRPGSTVAPSGVIPLEACASVTLALKNLEDPAKADRGILTDAARTLHERYPASSGDDIDTLLADALSRTNRDTTGAKTTAVLEASARLEDILAAACPG